MTEWIDMLTLAVFRLVAGVSAVALVTYAAAALVMAAIERVFAVAACVEAANEARRQGRAPILRAWLRFGTWWRG